MPNTSALNGSAELRRGVKRVINNNIFILTVGNEQNKEGKKNPMNRNAVIGFSEMDYIRLKLLTMP